MFDEEMLSAIGEKGSNQINSEAKNPPSTLFMLGQGPRKAQVPVDWCRSKTDINAGAWVDIS